MQNLQMESGPKYFKYGILAVIAIVFVAGAYTLTRTNNPPVETAAASTAVTSDQAMNEPAATQTDSQETVASSDAPADAASTAGTTPVTPATAESSPAATTAAASSVDTTMPAATQATAPEPVAAPTPATKPASTTAKAEENVESDSEVASAEPVGEPAHSVPKQAITGPRPSALDALDSWWSPSAASSFKVEYVGQLVDKNSLVILFSGPVQDTAAASQHIRVLAEDGSTVDTNWQTGGTSRMMVQNDLEPGRYIVMIDPAVSNAQGQALGSSLRGPVYIQ